MMKMVSMRNPKPDRTEKAESPCCEEYYEEYPYGLRLSLNDDNMSGLTEKLPVLAMAKAGQEMELMAKVRVKSVETSERDEKDGRKKVHRFELQITDMVLSSEDGLDSEFEQASKDD